MRVTINQPCPFAALHLWNRATVSDVMVHLTDAQFIRRLEKGSCAYPNAYELLVAGKRHKLTIPTRHYGTQDVAIRDVEIDYSQPWFEKHLRTIAQSYSRRPFYCDVFPLIEDVLLRKYRSIAELSMDSWCVLIGYLGFSFDVLVDTALPVTKTSDASGWMLDIAKAAGGTEYFCGQWAVNNYLRVDEFRSEGMEVVGQDWKGDEYPQMRDPFERNLSIIDLVMSVKPGDARWILHSTLGTSK